MTKGEHLIASVIETCFNGPDFGHYEWSNSVIEENYCSKTHPQCWQNEEK